GSGRVRPDLPHAAQPRRLRQRPEPPRRPGLVRLAWLRRLAARPRPRDRQLVRRLRRRAPGALRPLGKSPEVGRWTSIIWVGTIHSRTRGARMAPAPLTLMTIHAHPDDEAIGTGGILARYAAEGVQTVLVTCTRGE